jgi:hypothetical protein
MKRSSWVLVSAEAAGAAVPGPGLEAAGLAATGLLSAREMQRLDLSEFRTGFSMVISLMAPELQEPSLT